VSALEEPAFFFLVVGAKTRWWRLWAPPVLRGEPMGATVEICPAAAALAAALGKRFAHSPGAALFIDYGYFPARSGPTLAAVSQHRPVNPLENPGEADLSAHVDFSAFAAAARGAGAAVWGPVPPGRILDPLRADARPQALSARARAGQRAPLGRGLRALIDPDEMGTLFKAMAVTSPGLPAPAGFAEAEVSGGT